MTEPILSVRALARRRQAGDTVFRLRVPAFDLWPGDRVALTGVSGCGKSTLLDLLALVLGPDEARRFVLAPPDGGPPVDLLALWRRRDLDALAERRGRHMGYVLQTGGLLGFLTVRDNIALPRRRLGLPDDGTVEHLAERLGLIRHLGRRPGQLSVGERQRVAIARALAHRPPIVLADEPTAALDPVTANATMALLLALAEDLGVALVMASHDHDRIARFGLRPIAVHLAATPDGVSAVFEDQGP